MQCSKEAYEKCPYNEKCWPGCPVSDDSDCAEFIQKIAEEERHEQE